MTEPVLINAEEVHNKMRAGNTLLVCAYDDEEKFKNLHLEGAISLDSFKSGLSAMAKDQEIVFYCA